MKMSKNKIHKTYAVFTYIALALIVVSVIISLVTSVTDY